MTRAHVLTRWLLLGSDTSWGATVATGPLGIYLLAACALFLHVLDLATGLRMILVYGVQLELNPRPARNAPAGLVLGAACEGVQYPPRQPSAHRWW